MTNDILILKSNRLIKFHSKSNNNYRNIIVKELSYTNKYTQDDTGDFNTDYLYKLTKYIILTPFILLTIIYYIDRFYTLYPNFTINSLIIHRFFLITATIGSKGLSDSF